MLRSTDRILTTHVGSLPRPADLLDMMQAREQGKPVDEKAYARAAARRGRRDRAQAGRARHRRGRRRRVSASRASSPTSTSGSAASRPTDRPRPTNGRPHARRWHFRNIYNGPRPRGPKRPPNMVCTGPMTYKGQTCSSATSPTSRRRSAAPRWKKRSCRRSRRRTSRTGTTTPTTRPTRSFCSRSPTRCARNTRRSSRPAS